MLDRKNQEEKVEEMRLVNKTKRKTIARNVIMRVSVLEIMLGLIPYKIENRYVYDWLKWKIFKEDDVMFFKVSDPGMIHTFFMSFPIMLVFLDDNMRVVEKVFLQPFRAYIPKRNYKYFIELREEKMDEVSVGDILSIE